MDDDLIGEIAVSDEYLKAIGRMMVNWNQLDAIFDLVMIKLFGCRIWDVRSHMVIAGMNFGNKLEIVKSLAALQSSLEGVTLSAFINETLPKISALQAKRNAVAHYKWALKDGNVRGLRLQAKGKLKFTDATVPLADIQQASAAMIVLMNELFRMIPFAEFLERKST